MLQLKELTNDQRNHLRYAIHDLAKIETKRRRLSDVQLTLIFRLLAYGAPVSYYDSANDAVEDLSRNIHKPGETYSGYSGAGWFAEDHFNG